MKHIILFGPPGSGKGTQAELVANKFNLKHLSTGDLFRHHMKVKNSLGLKARSYIDQGLLVPDDVTTAMLEDFLPENDQPEAGIIYDGYPRTLQQAISLDELLERFSLGFVNTAFSFCVPDELLIKRLSLRGKTSGRSDDIDLGVIRKRIAEYYKKTAPLSEYYRKKAILTEINAKGNIEEIALSLELEIRRLSI
ncbi:adenylate kinase [Bacteroidetes bacterium endosymbiont of Geopemphigus sp.]|uniref:adenylate kinase n=1 Tax=Bacteroidetes bacterium endosymbiont of Geopemphigus sp. TaxID=2047937 RepID=UPI000CD0F423|nr:adenylate kinase [Bacteroidetes bacterium endosymbiont of Geopemphigus sp.]